MKRWLIMMVVASLMMIPAAVSADDGETQETVYDFDGEDLTGSLMRPHGEDIHADDRGRTSSLIDIREDFIPEMLESVESL